MAKEFQGKMYYSISEVAGMVGVEPYVLRFWEKEFGHLRPKKNRAGNRIYQPKDIQKVMQVKRLLHDEGYTIEGARNLLKRDGNGNGVDPAAARVKAMLREIREELEELLKLFP